MTNLMILPIAYSAYFFFCFFADREITFVELAMTLIICLQHCTIGAVLSRNNPQIYITKEAIDEAMEDEDGV